MCCSCLQRPGAAPNGVKEKTNGHVLLMNGNGNGLSGSSKDLLQTAILVEPLLPSEQSPITSPGKVS